MRGPGLLERTYVTQRRSEGARTTVCVPWIARSLRDAFIGGIAADVETIRAAKEGLARAGEGGRGFA